MGLIVDMPLLASIRYHVVNIDGFVKFLWCVSVQKLHLLFHIELQFRQSISLAKLLSVSNHLRVIIQILLQINNDFLCLSLYFIRL